MLFEHHVTFGAGAGMRDAEGGTLMGGVPRRLRHFFLPDPRIEAEPPQFEPFQWLIFQTA